MSREVLLIAEVPGLGVEGDVVHVAEGYARNYLLPRNLAAPVTEATKRRLVGIRKVREAKKIAELENAKAMAAKLEKASCTLSVKTGENDKLYGSVTTADIAENLKKQGIELDRHLIAMEEPIRELGVFTLKVKLHPEVEGSLRVWVVQE